MSAEGPRDPASSPQDGSSAQNEPEDQRPNEWGPAAAAYSGDDYPASAPTPAVPYRPADYRPYSAATPAEPTVQFAPPTYPTSYPTAADVSVPPPAAEPAARPRRRRTWLVVAIIIVAVLAALVVADRIAPIVAARRVGSQLKSEWNTSTEPQVTFGGFPFLTQLATSHFKQIEVSAQNVTVQQQDQSLMLKKVTATLQGVDASDDNRLTVDTLDASAVLGYNQVSTLLGKTVTYDDSGSGGRIRVEFLTNIWVTAALAVDPSDHTLQLSDLKIGIGSSSIPATQLDGLLNGILPTINLPQGMQLTGVKVSQDGIQLDGTGHDVTVSR